MTNTTVNWNLIGTTYTTSIRRKGQLYQTSWTVVSGARYIRNGEKVILYKSTGVETPGNRQDSSLRDERELGLVVNGYWEPKG